MVHCQYLHRLGQRQDFSLFMFLISFKLKSNYVSSLVLRQHIERDIIFKKCTNQEHCGSSLTFQLYKHGWSKEREKDKTSISSLSPYLVTSWFLGVAICRRYLLVPEAFQFSSNVIFSVENCSSEIRQIRGLSGSQLSSRFWFN